MLTNTLCVGFFSFRKQQQKIRLVFVCAGTKLLKLCLCRLLACTVNRKVIFNKLNTFVNKPF